jgi:hypothetical protein
MVTAKRTQGSGEYTAEAFKARSAASAADMVMLRQISPPSSVMDVVPGDVADQLKAFTTVWCG